MAAYFWHKICRRPVYILEPFHGYHHREGKFRFFPRPWAPWKKKFIIDNSISVIRAEEIRAAQIYSNVCEEAVANAVHMSGKAAGGQRSLENLVVSLMGADKAGQVFRINFVNQLAEYYSVRCVVRCLEQMFRDREIIFYPCYSSGAYLFFEHLHEDRRNQLRFSRFKMVLDRIKSFVAQWGNFAYIFLHCLYSVWAGLKIKSPAKFFRGPEIGLTLLSWDRQMENKGKSLTFLVDHRAVREKDLIYFCAFPLTPEQRKILADNPARFVEVPRTAVDGEGLRILFKASMGVLAGVFVRDDYLAKDYLITIKSFLVWRNLIRLYPVRHFITHSDFGPVALGRNAALKEQGVPTWFFTDSANQIYHFSSDEKHAGRHPLYCFLGYDHLVTWSKFLAEYFQAHPGSFADAHVVGCLWADHIVPRVDAESSLDRELYEKLKGKIIIAGFDSTYTNNALTSYDEGIAFARDMIKLVEQIDGACLLWREKKKRSLHGILGGTQGHELRAIYETMDRHPQIINATELLSSSQMISLSDMTVSFPFTSTTFEALSAGKPALWHDAKGLYLRARFLSPETVTHSFDQLAQKVRNLKLNQNPETAAPLRDFDDPYQDAGAVERFRTLLTG